MSLSLAEVRRSAALSRLRLTAEEEALFEEQLGKIVTYIDLLRGFETLPEEPDPSAGVEAADEPQPHPRAELLLENAPEVRGPYFVVPRLRAGGGGSSVDRSLDEAALDE